MSKQLTRREFVAGSALLGSVALESACAAPEGGLFQVAVSDSYATPGPYLLSRVENTIYSVCLQCHTACPIKARVLDGMLVKLTGNPYSPMNLLPQLPFDTQPEAAAPVDAKLCPKGQAGIQSLYDPYRLRKVLKRAGPRGSNRWQTIPFEQAIDEIVTGGKIFADIGEDHEIPGLKDLFVVRDPRVMSRLKADAAAVAGGAMSLSTFRRRHRAELPLLLDPEHPDLGPVNNQFVFLAGRIEHGRKEFSKRWLRDAFGSRNWFEHTSICEQSHHIAYNYMTKQFDKGKWTGGKTHMKPDALHSEFIIFFGTGAFEANFGPTNMAEKVTEGLASGRLKIAVVDPRLSKTAAKAWKWVPIKPGGDAAFALGMTRWILENERYDGRFLAAANRAAASVAGETSWSSASWLVVIEDGRPARFLRAHEVGVGSAAQTVVMRGGRARAVSADGAAVTGDLFVDTRLRGKRVKSTLQLLREQANARTLQEWADAAGADADHVVALARELTAHGKRAVVEFYRGPVQHTNGYYNAQAIIGLNFLIGNVDWKGGLGVGGGHWHEVGDKPGQPYPLTKGLHPGKLGSFGVPVNREASHYENSTLFGDYPARRPWYPFTSNVYQEVLPSAAMGYPYPIKALLLHKGTPIFSTPAGDLMVDYISDPERLPLFFACDVVIGETSMYADYIFPDISVWERWGTPHTTPDVQSKTSKIRQPIVSPIPETVTVLGEEMPISMEALMLAIAERLGLPGYGPNGLGSGQSFTRMEDYYLRMAANLAAGDKPGDAVAECDDAELQLFRRARRHLDGRMFDEERWTGAAGPDHWRRVVTLLNRGGRFEDFEKSYKGDRLAYQFKGLVNFFVEPVAQARHSITGEWFAGLALFEPVLDAAGRPVPLNGDPLKLITYKDILGGHSRTSGNYWVTSALPENYALMNRADGRKFDLRDGDRVRITSKSNPDGIWRLGEQGTRPVEIKVKLVEGMRPGVVAVSWHYGHWAYGASDVVIDGETVRGDARRATGACPNSVMTADPHLEDVCLTDPIGGSASFYDTWVTVSRVAS